TSVFFASTGQAAPEPVQDSAASHTSTAARHSVPAALNPSTGHASCAPSHRSSASHGPAAAPQTLVFFPSAGQAASAPVQRSAASPAATAARHPEPAALR